MARERFCPRGKPMHSALCPPYKSMTRLPSPAEQENRLLAEQVPEPPRRTQAQRPSPGIERHRLFHLGADHIAQRPEILDGAEMDVGRIPPCVGKIVGLRHVTAEQK